jgi:hypothetical protein
MLTKKDIRTDEQLKADGFNPADIKRFRKAESGYYGLLVELDDATAKKDYDLVIDLEAKIEPLEFRLLYQGKNPKEVPVAALKSILHDTACDDFVIKTARKRVRNQGTGIRAFCITCMGGQAAEVRRCGAIACPLWPFRLGKNPFFGKTQMPKAVIVDPDLVEDEIEGDDDGGDDGD